MRRTATAVFDKYCKSFFQFLQFIRGNGNVNIEQSSDGVLNHSCNLLILGILFRIIQKTTEVGDGDRNVRNWKLSLLLYHSTRKYKYRLESFLFTSSVKALLPIRMAQQIIWNRYINLTRGEGKNLDGDYVIELHNRLAKDRIKSLGPNHIPENVNKIGKTVQILNDIEKHLCSQTKSALISQKHTKIKDTADFSIVLQELCQNNIFIAQNDRVSYFGLTGGNMFVDFNKETFRTFINENKEKYSQGKSMLH